MPGSSRADGLGFVGRRGDNRDTAFFYQFQCNGMIGHSDSYGSEAGTGQIYSRVGVLLKTRQDESQRSRPVFLCQSHYPFVRLGVGFEKIQFGNVRDQRVEGRTSLGGKNVSHGLRIINICAQPVYGFGWHGDEAAVLDNLGRLLDVF